jgi:hypothetical protein
VSLTNAVFVLETEKFLQHKLAQLIIRSDVAHREGHVSLGSLTVALIALAVSGRP